MLFGFLPLRIVRQNHLQLVEFLGKFSRVLEPGLNILVPFLESVVRDVNLASQNFIFEVDTVSSDKVNVKLKANLIYSVRPDKVKEFHYNLANPLQTLSSFVDNYVRSFVATQTHEELLSRREEVADYLIQHLDAKMSEWGMKIDSFQVMDIAFPPMITDAMSRVVASQRLREAAMNEAEAAKIKVVKEAEAEKESRILLGEGIAGERQAIVDGLKLSINDMKSVSDLKIDDVMNLVVISQYFDTMKSIGDGPNSKVLFMNTEMGNMNDMVKGIVGSLEASKSQK